MILLQETDSEDKRSYFRATSVEYVEYESSSQLQYQEPGFLAKTKATQARMTTDAKKSGKAIGYIVVVLQAISRNSREGVSNREFFGISTAMVHEARLKGLPYDNSFECILAYVSLALSLAGSILDVRGWKLS